MKVLITIIIATLLAVSYAGFVDDCLEVHNKYRARLGLPDLTWSNSLAVASQFWAIHQAANSLFAHSTNRGDNIGENIAVGTSRVYSPPELVEEWADERQYFISGRDFPYCSTTGDYHDVGHYTQMIWEKTEKVGCGSAISLGRRYLVCRYYPAGNIMGYPVY